MIVVTVELWPYGDEQRKRRLGTGIIANDGTGSRTRGNYSVRLWTGAESAPWRSHQRPVFSGIVEEHQRLRYSFWHLIRKAMDSCLKSA